MAVRKPPQPSQQSLDDFIDMVQERSEDHDQLKRMFQQAWDDAIRAYSSVRPAEHGDETPATPSPDVIDFAMRALGNPNVRSLMERMAQE